MKKEDFILISSFYVGRYFDIPIEKVEEVLSPVFIKDDIDFTFLTCLIRFVKYYSTLIRDEETRYFALDVLRDFLLQTRDWYCVHVHNKLKAYISGKKITPSVFYSHETWHKIYVLREPEGVIGRVKN